MKKVTITWTAQIRTQKEVDELIKSIADIHRYKYGTPVARRKLLETGHYSGSMNTINVKIEE